MGYNLMENFRRPIWPEVLQGFGTAGIFPYTTWFRDYVYAPLAKKARRNKKKLLGLYSSYFYF